MCFARYGTLENTPVQFINAWVDKVELCAMYAIADVAMITSLRDGFNKVAFEYVSDNPNRTVTHC